MLWEIETLQTLTRWRRTKVDQTALSILHFCITFLNSFFFWSCTFLNSFFFGQFTFLNSKRVVLPQKTNKPKKKKENQNGSLHRRIFGTWSLVVLVIFLAATWSLVVKV